MNPNYMSDNYRLRKHYLSTNELPTQTLIKNKMSAPLAAIFFKALTPKLKVMVGLEPPMKGGGGDWYVPPEEILAGRTVLKPIKTEVLSKLNYLGIDTIGMKLFEGSFKGMQAEIDKAILESDKKWDAVIKLECQECFKDSIKAAERNTVKIRKAFNEFTHLYRASITGIENLLSDAAHTEIIKIQNQARQSMIDKYNVLIKKQAITLYDMYKNKLMAEKSRLKTEYLEKLAVNHTEMKEKIHDLNVEKHVAMGKLRKYLECQSLACQVYVALKEREECQKERDESTRVHRKKVKILADNISLKDRVITHLFEKEKQLLEVDALWQKKVWHIVKKFQMLISYCLSLLPEHADFFINMEKLMLLQFNEVLENPNADSIFEVDDDYYEGPTPQPNVFYLFCDKSRKHETRIEKHLCPKRGTSSASQMPVIVINKQCIYAACDNFELFTDKVTNYINGKYDDAVFTDDNVYEHYVPVKYTFSQQLLELKLESSLIQILQQELPNIREVPIECVVCKMPYCSCTSIVDERKSIDTNEEILEQQPVSDMMSASNENETRSAKLDHEREPKWESYLKYVEPKKCLCAKTSKKHLMEHLPIYMRSMSVYDKPELPNYEVCSLDTLKKMVKDARRRPPRTMLIKRQPNTRDVATQSNDEEFDFLCDCLSENELQRLLKNHTFAGSKLYHHLSRTEKRIEILDSAVASTPRTARSSSFVRRSLVEDSPVLKELFKRRHSCKSFD